MTELTYAFTQPEQREMERKMRRETRRLGPTPSVRNIQNIPAQTQGAQVADMIAKYPYQGRNMDELTFNVGERLYGFQLVDNGMWWYGENAVTRQRGLFPAAFVTPNMPNNENGGPSKGGSKEGGGKSKEDEVASRIPLTIFAHNIANAGAWNSLAFAIFSVFWTLARQDPNSTPDKLESLLVIVPVWIYAFAIVIPVWVFEWFWGLQRPLSYSAYLSPRGIGYFALAIPLYLCYTTMIPGGIFTACGIIHMIADYNRECGKHITPKGEKLIHLPGRSFLSPSFLLFCGQ